jgi:NADPH:quinone reductase-like Zn-dependent oxidoreductase
MNMKAIVYTEYGPPEVLRLQEVAKPAPGAKDVLIRNHATSVKYGDLAARNFKAISRREFNMPALFWLLARLSFGLNKPKNNYPGQRVCRGSGSGGSGRYQL